MVLTKPEIADILERYARNEPVAETSYATVRDFCDSADRLPQITRHDGDLKNVQRPWAVKAILRSIPPPARLLEIGGGEPIVSDLLHQLGYDVTLVDPYDGSGNGPTEYEAYCKAFPNVRIIRDYFRPSLPSLIGEKFGAIFSISVLEHFSDEPMNSCFLAIGEFLRPGGVSAHCFDFIVQGLGDVYDLANAQQILERQAALVHKPPPDFHILLTQLRQDVETFFLSPQGHHLWRTGRPYAEFPFRKVVSLQTIALKCTGA
ncbi:MAG: class I SAM-dependent methyltransferase [Chthoniobacterales bacterium]|jgi:xanthine/CO dehydrogenase XdhC/CoxF family maturation factor